MPTPPLPPPTEMSRALPPRPSSESVIHRPVALLTPSPANPPKTLTVPILSRPLSRLLSRRSGKLDRFIEFPQEGSPLLIANSMGNHAHQWRPSRPTRRATQPDPRLLWRAATFAPVARNATTNDVFPSRLAALGSWDHVVEIQLGAGRHTVTILTGVRVSRKNVRATEANVFARHAVVGAKHDHAGNRDLSGQGSDEVPASGYRASSHAPMIKIEGFVIFVDRVRTPAVDQREGSANRRDMNRQK